MKRLLLAVGLVVVVVAAVALWQTNASANCRIEGDKLAVFVGGPVVGSGTVAQYVGERAAVLSSLLSTEPDRALKAVVVFDRFMGPAEANVRVSSWGLEPVEIYVALPGEAYSGGAVVTSSVMDAYQTHVVDLTKMAEEMAVRDPENTGIQSDAAMANEGKLALYAVVVRGTARSLSLAGGSHDVLIVDPFSNEKAERLASSRGLTIDWRVVPVRPDGRP